MQRDGRMGGGWAAIGAVLAALSIGLSAYAAHALADVQARGNLQTASLYAFAHGAVLVLLAPAPRRLLRWLALAGLLLGTLLFSGSLAGSALLGWPTRLAPMGGMLMMAGWLLLAIDAIRR